MANTASCCDTCTFYIYDDEYECYTCDRDLDEDEMMRFLTDNIISALTTDLEMNTESSENRCKL